MSCFVHLAIFCQINPLSHNYSAKVLKFNSAEVRKSKKTNSTRVKQDNTATALILQTRSLGIIKNNHTPKIEKVQW